MMTRKRQRAVFDRFGNPRAAITTLTRDYPPGHVTPLHFHDRDQLVYASSGVMTVRTDGGTWVVPPLRAVWIPADVPHAIMMSGAVAMRTLYFKRRLAKGLPRACCVVNIAGLLRELILYACTLRELKTSVKWQDHAIEMILHQLRAVRTVPLQLPNLSDRRLARIAELLTDNPGDARTLVELSEVAGASKRSIERLFQHETGMTFGQWRQQVRLMHAVRLLAEGAKVSHAALEAGYSTPSAFIAMFKNALGSTPSAYFRTATAVTEGGSTPRSRPRFPTARGPARLRSRAAPPQKGGTARDLSLTKIP